MSRDQMPGKCGTSRTDRTWNKIKMETVQSSYLKQLRTMLGTEAKYTGKSSFYLGYGGKWNPQTSLIIRLAIENNETSKPPFPKSIKVVQNRYIKQLSTLISTEAKDTWKSTFRPVCVRKLLMLPMLTLTF